MELIRLEGTEQFKPKVIDLFMNARYEANVVSSLYPEFYNDDGVKNALQHCVENTKRFRLLIDDGKNIETTKSKLPWLIELKNKYPNKLEIRFSDDPSLRHIMIIDNRNLRIEDTHECEKLDNAKNLIIKDAPEPIVDAAVALFESWWTSGKEFEIKQTKLPEVSQALH